jgi:hypothetical protein
MFLGQRGFLGTMDVSWGTTMDVFLQQWMFSETMDVLLEMDVSVTMDVTYI